ncbi:transposase, partial [Cutibacterium acnes]
TPGHREALRWARRQFGDELEWAIEDCRHLSTRLEMDLLAAGQVVVRVPPKMMAHARASARTRGKSDPIDALAVARAALAEPGLPRAVHDEQARELKLLVDRRDTLVKQRTATINSLLWRVHELDPEHEIPAGAMDRIKHQRALQAWLEGRGEGVVVELALDELSDICAVSVRIKDLEKRIAALVSVRAPAL